MEEEGAIYEVEVALGPGSPQPSEDDIRKVLLEAAPAWAAEGIDVRDVIVDET